MRWCCLEPRPWVQLAVTAITGLWAWPREHLALCSLPPQDCGHILLVLTGRQPGLSMRAALASRRDQVRRESPGGPGDRQEEVDPRAGLQPPALVPQPTIPGMGCQFPSPAHSSPPWSVLGIFRQPRHCYHPLPSPCPDPYRG